MIYARRKPSAHATPNTQSPLFAGLAGGWALLEGAGGQTYDVLGLTTGAFEGTAPNLPVWVSGPSGFELDFTAANDTRVNLGNPPALNIRNDISVAVSYKLKTSATNYQLCSKDKDTGGRSYTLDILDVGGARFYINGGTSLVQEGRGPVAGDDRAVVGTYRSGSGNARIELWIEGRLVTANNGGDASIPVSTANVMIGRREYAGATQPLNGQIRYAYIWRRALSAGEIRQLYLDPYQLFAAPLSRRVIGFAVSRPHGGIADYQGVATY